MGLIPLPSVIHAENIGNLSQDIYYIYDGNNEEIFFFVFYLLELGLDMTFMVLLLNGFI